MKEDNKVKIDLPNQILDGGKYVQKKKAGKKERKCGEKGVVGLVLEAREVKFTR